MATVDDAKQRAEEFLSIGGLKRWEWNDDDLELLIAMLMQFYHKGAVDTCDQLLVKMKT